MGNKIFTIVFNSDLFLCYKSLFYIISVSYSIFHCTYSCMVHKNNIFELK